MKNFFFRLLITAFSVIIVAYLVPGVHVSGFSAAFMVALVLSFLNAFLKPVLLILTIPITLFSFGLFLFVLNAIIVQIADYILDKFAIDNFLYALLFSIILSIVNTILESIFGPKSKAKENE
jgi:putative membrane protein